MRTDPRPIPAASWIIDRPIPIVGDPTIPAAMRIDPRTIPATS